MPKRRLVRNPELIGGQSSSPPYRGGRLVFVAIKSSILEELQMRELYCDAILVM